VIIVNFQTVPTVTSCWVRINFTL